MNGSFSQPLHFLSDRLSAVYELLKSWEKTGEVEMLDWRKINDSLSVANLETVLGFSIPSASISLIRVSGNIAPHKHVLSNSAGVVLSETSGFAFPEDGIEIYLDGSWRVVKSTDVFAFTAGSPHGFRKVGGHPLFLLFLDSPPIDDSKDHILVDI